MKKATFLVALLAIPAFAFAGSAAMSLLNADDMTGLATVPAAGGAFKVAVMIDSVTGAPEGVSNFAGTIVASQSHVFTMFGRSLVGCGPFKDSDLIPPLEPAVGHPLNPVSPPIGIVAASGNYPAVGFPWKVEIFLMTVEANPNPTTPRDLFLDLSSDSYVGTTIDYGALFPLPTQLSGMKVTQLPEPATMLLLAAALPLLRGGRRRRAGEQVSRRAGEQENR